MKLGIMQPYFFPYIGYWQLLNAVDTYVVYDDVTFIKGGWIHRNRIQVNGQAQFINIQMAGASSFRRICDIGVNPDLRWRKKLLQTLYMAYHRAPHYKETFPLVEDIITCTEKHLGSFLFYSLETIAKHLSIETKLIRSSSWQSPTALHGKARVLDICKRLGASEYYNAIGGQDLYSKEDFANQGIQLYFLQSDNIIYPQRTTSFLSGLSIIDVLMENPLSEVHRFLLSYQLV